MNILFTVKRDLIRNRTLGTVLILIYIKRFRVIKQNTFIFITNIAIFWISIYIIEKNFLE